MFVTALLISMVVGGAVVAVLRVFCNLVVRGATAVI